MKEVFLAGEDEVTKAIIRRTVAEYAPNLRVKMELPARGGELKSKIVNFNNLSLTDPVILLTDLDAENCAPAAKERLLAGIKQADHFIVNIAVDEAEAWLMADREGFAKYLGVAIEDMPMSEPQKQGGRKPLKEMKIPVKASYYLTHKLALEPIKRIFENVWEQVVRIAKGKSIIRLLCLLSRKNGIWKLPKKIRTVYGG